MDLKQDATMRYCDGTSAAKPALGETVDVVDMLTA